MDLKKDIDELKDAWPKASPSLKAYLILSFFLNTSSIASLSEEIVKYKGFFKDALDFYREWITAPLQGLFRIFFDFRLPSEAVDYLVLSFIVVGSLSRTTFFQAKRLGMQGERKKKYFIRQFGWIFFIMTSQLVAVYRVYQDEWANKNALLPSLLITVAVLAFFLRRLPRVYWLVVYGPFVFAVTAVGILGAINRGLSG